MSIPAFYRPSPFDIPEDIADCYHSTLGNRWIAAHKQGKLWKCRDTDTGECAVALTLEGLADRSDVFTYKSEFGAYEQAIRIYRVGED